MDLEEINFMVGPDGENNRDREADEERTAAARRALEQTLFPLILLIILLLLGNFLWCFVLLHAIAVKFFLGYDLASTFSILFLNIGVLFPPVTEVLIYSIYILIEREAFEEFENMFPAFQDGQGDSKRLQFFTWKELSKILWMKRINIFKTIKENIKPIILFICGVILVWDIGFKLNELYLLYFNLPPSYKFLIMVLISIVAVKYEYIPYYLAMFLMFDSYCEFHTPVIYTIVAPITLLSLLFWIPRALGLYFIYKKSRELQEERSGHAFPSMQRVGRVVTGRIAGDPDERIISTLILFMRWLETTGQVQRITDMGIDQLPLVHLNE